MKQSLFKNSRFSRYLIIMIIVLLASTGLALIGNGLWIKAKAELAQLLLNQAFDRARRNSDITLAESKPWSWADIQPIARLNVPRLNQTSIVLNNTSGEALAFGPGHIANTPMPGEYGTSVLAAHRDTHFSWIRHLQSGDRLEIERTDGSQFAFKVKRSWIAHFDNSGINAHSQGRFIALSTCYPFDQQTPGPLRYVVEAEIDTSPKVPASPKLKYATTTAVMN